MSFVNPYAAGSGAAGAGIAREWPWAAAIRPPPMNNVVMGRSGMPGGAQVVMSVFNSPHEAFDVPFDRVNQVRGTASATILSTAADFALSPVGQVSKFASGSSTYKTIAYDLSQLGATISLSWWMYWDAFANDNAIAWEYTANAATATNSAINCNPNNSASGKFSLSIQSNSGAKVEQAATVRPTGAAWHHYAATINRAAGANAIIPFFDAVNQQGATTYTDTSMPTAAAWQASSSFNFFSRNAASNFASGRIAYFNLFNGTLTADDVRRLYFRPWYLLRGRTDWT